MKSQRMANFRHPQTRRALWALLLAFVPLALQAQTETPLAPEPDLKSKGPYQRSRLTRDESEATADRRDILLTVGEDETLDLDFDPDWDQIVIGNPGVLTTTNVRALRQLILKPTKDGETTVQLRDPTGALKLVLDVSVTKSNLVRRAKEIRELLKDVEGLRVRVIGQRVVVSGDVIVASDYAEVLKVLNDVAYKDIVINQAKLSPLGFQLLAKKIEEEIQKFAPKVTTRVVNSVILIEGIYPRSIPCQEDSTKDENYCLIEKTVTLYAPPVLPGISPLLGSEAGVRSKDGGMLGWASIRVKAEELPPPPIVEAPPMPPPPPPAPVEPDQLRITLHFVELSKDYSRLHAFKWQPGFTFDPTITVGASSTGQTSAGGTSFTGTISSLFPKLKNAESAGFARILKTATVVTRDKSQAKVEQRTQIPIVAVGPGGAQSQSSQDVAFGLLVTPTITPGTQSLMLDVNFQSGSIVGRVSSSGALTATNTAQTSFFMRAGETAAIAAFNTTDIGTDFNKDDPRAQTAGAAIGDPSQPSTGATSDPLFSLLSSKNYRKKKSQVVVFITPEILNNPAVATEDLKKNFRIRVN